MGKVKPGDIISIKFPERNSLVKAGKLELRAPEAISATVPDTLNKRELGLLDSLVDWDILKISTQQMLVEMDPLDEELLAEYEYFGVNEALNFISRLSDKRRIKFLGYERDHKNRKTITRAFK